MRIALVTCARFPVLTPDDDCLRAALVQRSHTVVTAVWDDAGVDWEAFEAVVIRSCWDYHERPEAFLNWINRLEAAGVRLWNDPTTLRWNIDKSYLLDLAGRGLPVVPTRYLTQGEHISLTTVLEDANWDEVVVKPSIAATAFHTWRTNRAGSAADQARFAQLLAERAMLVQPFQPEIQAGEYSLMFFGGVYSHTVLKQPAPGDFRSQSDYNGREFPLDAPPELIAQARQFVAALPSTPLYARVDGLLVHGRFTLMELELIEPYLFLASAPHAPDLLATALEHRQGG